MYCWNWIHCIPFAVRGEVVKQLGNFHCTVVVDSDQDHFVELKVQLMELLEVIS